MSRENFYQVYKRHKLAITPLWRPFDFLIFIKFYVNGGARVCVKSRSKNRPRIKTFIIQTLSKKGQIYLNFLLFALAYCGLIPIIDYRLQGAHEIT